MKKTIKKLAALLLAGALAVTAVLPAFAAEGDNFTITITKDASDKAAHTYGAYQIFKGKLETKDGKQVLSDIQWGDNVDSSTAITELKKIAAFSSLANDASASTVAKAISDAKLNDDSEGAQAIADAFAKAVARKTAKATGNIAATATSGTISIPKTDAGYYFVKDESAVTGEGAQTRYILQIVSDVSVTEKANVPSVTKKVKEKNDTTGNVTGWQDAADYDIGDSIPYKLEGTLPSKFAEYDTYTVYTFVDELSEGLTPPAAKDVHVHLDAEDGTSLDDYFNVAVTDQKITVSLKANEDLRQIVVGGKKLTKDNKIVVTYNAVLNAKAKIGSQGNPNEVYLEFTNNPNGEQDGEKGTTPIDKVIVFTYTIKALKVEPDGNAIDQAAYDALPAEQKADYVKIGDKWQKTKALAGAGFTLYKKVPAGTDGAVDGYLKIGNEITGVTTFEFKGTDAGEYKLVETTVPTGYNKADDITIIVTATYDTDSADPKLKSLTVTPETAGFTVSVQETKNANDEVTEITTDGEITGKVVNQSGSTLPATGGMGTTIFYVIGGILVLAAAIILISRRRVQQ